MAAVVAVALVVATRSGGGHDGTGGRGAAPPVPMTSPGHAVGAAEGLGAPTDVVGVGADPMGSLRGPPPPDARYVAPDGDDAAPGSATAPWATLAHAVDATPPGGTVVLRAGEYHEQVQVYGKTLHIQAHPGEVVWMTGSEPVSGWTADGDVWRVDGWTTRFEGTAPSADWVDPAHPAAARPDMFFRDGVALEQVEHRTGVRPGTFFVDEATSQVFIGDDPSGHVVLGTTLEYALWINEAPGSTVTGIGFTAYGSSNRSLAAVRASSDDVVLEQNVFADNAWAGVSLLGARATLRSNTASGNGLVGVHGWHADDALVEHNLVEGNNREQFRPWASGGLKISGSSDVTIRDNVVRDNVGSSGIWLDVTCVGVDVVRNDVLGNGRTGIQVETSRDVVVAGNVVRDNALHGVYVSESAAVEVWNNLVVDNLVGIRVFEGERDADDAEVWQVDRVVVRNNVVAAPSGRALVSVEDIARARGALDMGVSLDANVYSRPDAVAGDGPAFVWAVVGGADRHVDLGAFRAATGQETEGQWLGERTGALAGGSVEGTAIEARVAAALELEPGLRPRPGVPPR